MLKLKVVISKVPIYSSTNVLTTVYNVTDVCVSDRGLENILFPMFEEKKRVVYIRSIYIDIGICYKILVYLLVTGTYFWKR